jgi:hypothetical protein
MCLFICWGFFVINNGLLVDLVKPQMLWCIIYRFEQVSSDVLVQRYLLHKVNGITLMTTHVQTTHPRLFAQKEEQLNEKVAKLVA